MERPARSPVVRSLQPARASVKHDRRVYWPLARAPPTSSSEASRWRRAGASSTRSLSARRRQVAEVTTRSRLPPVTGKPQGGCCKISAISLMARGPATAAVPRRRAASRWRRRRRCRRRLLLKILRRTSHRESRGRGYCGDIAIFGRAKPDDTWSRASRRHRTPGRWHDAARRIFSRR